MDLNTTWLILATFCSFLCVRTIYRLYFHPLSKFPGPRLTAATHLYEFYYDVVKGGRFIFQIEKMHEKYGQYTMSSCKLPR